MAFFEFVDIETGRVFNGDQPYVHRFNGGQSVGLMYVERLCVVSDSDSITASIPQNSIFSLLDVSGLDNSQYINGKEFWTLDDDSRVQTITSTGASAVGYYIHTFYIIASSDNAGEYTDVLQLTASQTTKEFSISADFYNMNELLESNLKNFGFSIPNAVQKSIYEENIAEDLSDNILLNRKLKELLLNYWDMLANKGSYDSLKNSLSWFEYGDLVRMREYWKRDEDGMMLLEGRRVDEIMDEHIKEYMQSHAKTTYIGLYLALEKYKDINGYVLYQDYDFDPASEDPDFWDSNQILPEYMPALTEVVTKWDAIDLSLKMTLLGNFFATFFMPIHLDLIHSAIEHVAVAPAVKVLSAASLDRVDVVADHNVLNMDVKSSFYLRPVGFRTYTSTLFGNVLYIDSNNEEFVIGAETSIRPLDSDMDEPFEGHGAAVVASHWANWPACPVRFDCNINDDGFIQREAVAIAKKTETGYEDVVCGEDFQLYQSVDGHISFSFELMFYHSGEYRIGFAFTSNSGHAYSKEIEVTIKDDARQCIKLYKVKRRDDLESLEDLPNNIQFKNTPFQQFRPYSDEWMYTQYVNTGFGGNGVGLNHTVVLDKDSGDNVDTYVTISTPQSYDPYTDVAVADLTLSDLTNTYPLYWWYEMQRYANESSIGDTSKLHTVFVGISKRYSDELGGIDKVNIHTILTQPPTEPRIVDENRFYPILHVFEPLEDNRCIDWGETVACIPDFDKSLDFEESPVWIFKNASTGRMIESHLEKYVIETRNYGNAQRGIEVPVYTNANGGTVAGLSADFNDSYPHYDWEVEARPLDPGYYDIILHYNEGGNTQEAVFESAFRINKIKL